MIRDLISVIGAIFFYGKNFVISSKWFGKLATVIFYIAIVISMIIKYFNLNYTFDIYIYYLALGCAIFSFVMYARIFIPNFKKKK
ncbi:MAG: hypothetical protein LBL91_00465 [Lachnospiraceae bacterium]|jgi:cardiolipin synthase|nr:hypothetical protein [Lachnospiraceae bacterium]